MSWYKKKQYFYKSELACKCGCGVYLFDKELLKILNAVRHEYGLPIFVTSGYRCKEHNDFLPNSSPTSSHRKGRAVDISCHAGNRFILVKLLIKHGVTRIGVGKDFIHADIDPMKNQERMWLY